MLWSEAAGERHDNAVEGWGENAQAQIGRLCRFFVAQGMPLPFECPKAPQETGAANPGQ